MLDIQAIRENPEDFKRRLARKGIEGSMIDELLGLDEKLRETIAASEKLKAEQNEASKKIPQLEGEEKAQLLAQMKEISERKKIVETERDEAEKNCQDILQSLPNTPHDEAPNGKDDTENKVIKTWGEKPNFSFPPKEHWELGELLGILDLERGAKVSGARFYYLRNQLAILQQALIFWAFTEVAKKGYSATIPPFMTRSEAIYGTGYLERNENYIVNPGEDDLYLIGTSEVPMMSYHAGDILEEKDLPLKFVAYSPCFRREAGSYGKDTKGILRVHQFEKVEMVMLALPEMNEALHEEIRGIEEELLQKLEIPYQVVDVCCGDLGNSASKKYDLEAWLPGQDQYREMTSTSICNDWQTRRLNIRVRRENGELVYAQALNGTAVSSRPLIAILENFQQEDGSVLIPEILRPFCGFDKIAV